MDTIHDLGGRQGFGPIEYDKDDDAVAFHADWEARAFALCFITWRMWATSGSHLNVDWFRHVRERIDPLDYLARPYFDQWVQSLAAIFIESGAINSYELTGNALTSIKTATENVQNETETYPAATEGVFNVGQIVIAKTATPAPYTRLPNYVRGRRGEIILKHGLQPFSDILALGYKRKEEMYTVGFKASELWQDAEDERDIVYIDLWESHLVPVC